MYKRILVPVDGSPTSERGLDHAIKLAHSGHATLYLLHVVDELAVVQNAEAAAAIADRIIASLRDSGRKILARASDKAVKRGVKTRTLLVESVVRGIADVIVANAAKCRANLIVMGTHGRRGLTRVVMGSDAEGVVRNSPVPVLLVRMAASAKR